MGGRSVTPAGRNVPSVNWPGCVRKLASNLEGFMNTLLDRFCRYVRIDTQADEKAKTYPSSPGQLELGRLLRDELPALGLRDAEQDAHGIVLATLPATARHSPPTIARIAHV